MPDTKVEPAKQYVEPTLDEQRRLIHDETVPEPIRWFWRQRLYGAGGTGRKGIQQDRVQRLQESLRENFKVRMLDKLVGAVGNQSPKSAAEHLPGKRRKRARRLMRQLAKVVKTAS
jgi:hypothetical protein